jgi:hypothetical protein
MKNIHVVPTDKPSRLYVDSQNNICITDVEMKSGNKQHIYITSDEEIKEGDWYLIEFNGLKITQCTSTEELISIEGRNDCKKIILTTDQDLIKDGVQAIDDEFLEWFVKNPSCEEVKVKKEKQHIGEEIDESYPKGFFDYKIIIPQEEAKQDQVERMYSEVDMINYALYIYETKKNLLSPSEWWFEQFKKK